MLGVSRLTVRSIGRRFTMHDLYGRLQVIDETSDADAVQSTTPVQTVWLTHPSSYAVGWLHWLVGWWTLKFFT